MVKSVNYESLFKQSPRARFSRFSSVVTKLGLQRSSYDHSMFFALSKSRCILLEEYVDDIVVTGSDENQIKKLKISLHPNFKQRTLVH